MNGHLDHWGPILTAMSATAANDAVFEYLSPLDRDKFARALKRLEVMIAWKPPTKGTTTRAGTKLSAKDRQTRDRGRKSRLIGLMFERLLKLLFAGGAITALSNIRTTTSEIDLLLRVEPMGAYWIPMLRDAGTHMVAEAKCHKKPPSSELANEFAGVLGTHSASIGVLFVNCRSRDIESSCRFAIALHWKDGFEIVPIGKKQLDEVKRGAPFLRVLSDQHLLAKTHSSKLGV